MKTKIAHVSINQTAMNFTNNKRRIIETIKAARKKGCSIRTCQELEICGYSCEDHYKELDTERMCWKILSEILQEPGVCEDDILITTSMPILHQMQMLNAQIVIYNRNIVLIRPKLFLADGKNYYESRFFKPYTPPKNGKLEEYQLPLCVTEATGQLTAPIGIANLKLKDAEIGLEICEEVWRLNLCSRKCLFNSDIILCCNGSYFTTNRLYKRLQTIKSTMRLYPGVYIYSNIIGCDGARIYFDGGNLVTQNGKLIQQGKEESLEEFVVNEVVLSLEKIWQDRNCFIRKTGQFVNPDEYNLIEIDFSLGNKNLEYVPPNIPCKLDQVSTNHQILRAITSYIWDYLRKSGGNGFFLPLSGGADSAITALMAYFFAERVISYVKDGSIFVLKTIRKIVGEEDYVPEDPKELVSRILWTCYMGTSNSSEDTKKRARDLAKFIGANHQEIDITSQYKNFKDLGEEFLGFQPRFKSEGGTWGEDLALQNIQARVRLVLAYLMAQLIPVQNKTPEKWLLVFSTGNVDEALLGYFTKYDCASGDINLIGSLKKVRINSILDYFYEFYGLELIKEIREANPSAELQPKKENEKAQSDTDDLGVSYQQISIFNRLRKSKNMGMVSSFKFLLENEIWAEELTCQEILNNFKNFYNRYRVNRHKAPILTPCIHLSNNSCTNARYDVRPYLYETRFQKEYREIDNFIIEREKNKKNNRNEIVTKEGASKVEKVSDGGEVMDFTEKEGNCKYKVATEIEGEKEK